MRIASRHAAAFRNRGPSGRRCKLLGVVKSPCAPQSRYEAFTQRRAGGVRRLLFSAGGGLIRDGVCNPPDHPPSSERALDFSSAC